MKFDIHLKLLLIGMDEATTQQIREFVPQCEIVQICGASEFEASYEGWSDGQYAAVFCGQAEGSASPLEVGQTLLNQCPLTAKIFVGRDPQNYEPRNLIRNGFNKAFLLPIDRLALERTIVEAVQSGKKSYRSVQVLDLGKDDLLDFSTYVYLPLNKRYVRFSIEGQGVTEKKQFSLSKRDMSAVFVETKDMPKFYQYSATRLRNLGQDKSLGATERLEKLRENIGNIFSDIFDASVKADFEGGRAMMENCSGIIASYITNGADSDWHNRLLSSIGEITDAYGHASNVANFAALFAIGLGHPNPEDLATAGLFHDIGESAIPEVILLKPDAERTGAESEVYWSHPEKSVNAIKAKRISITPEVEKAILQHHESWNGKGKPRQLPPDRISDAAQLLSFADQFDHCTRMEPGKPRMSPLEALEAIGRTGSINPMLISKIRQLLDRSNSQMRKKSA